MEAFVLFNKIRSAYLRNEETSFSYAGIALFEFVSFRFNSKFPSYSILLLKALKETILGFFGDQKIIISKSNSKVAFLDVDFESLNVRIDYAKEVLKFDPKVFLSKNNLLLRDGIFFNLKILFTSVILFFKLLATRMRNARKINVAFSLKEVIENICLIQQLKKHEITTLVDFANYEVDSNFLYLLLRERGIIVYKVPSPGPLFMHNAILFTDYLVLSSGYQLEELNTIHSIKYKFLIKAIPEMGLSYLRKYLSDETHKRVQENDFKFKLGYYSHGSWLREKEEDADNGLNLLFSEVGTLKIINEFLLNNGEYNLTLFLHPREKDNCGIEELTTYYDSVITSKKYKFADFAINSTESFNEINIAIVALSTILFERLLVGKKVLICNIGINGFPIPQSALQNIVFNNCNELEKLVEENAAISDHDFFEKNRIENHTYVNFKNYKPIVNPGFDETFFVN